jgi:hypothetical protein
MDQSPQEHLESIVRSLEVKGIPAAPALEATVLAVSHPAAISDLAIAVMRRFPKGGAFLNGALSYLPQGWSGFRTDGYRAALVKRQAGTKTPR